MLWLYFKEDCGDISRYATNIISLPVITALTYQNNTDQVIPMNLEENQETEEIEKNITSSGSVYNMGIICRFCSLKILH